MKNIKYTRMIVFLKNQRAFLFFECILAIALIGVFSILSRSILNNNLKRASTLMEHALYYTKVMALTQSTYYSDIKHTKWLKERFPSINPEILVSNQTFWQLQFHQTGIYTRSSFSIYLDTPRYADTTHYDGRPMSGDLIAIEGQNLRCLSGYNNTNISDFCKNNADTAVRLLESFNIQLSIKIQENCKERQTARISFNSYGKPYCGDKTKLVEPLIITLKGKSSTNHICVIPPHGIIFQGKTCEKYL